MMVEARRARGRPRIEPSERRRNNVTMRLRDETKARLERDARDNQRSLSEEIEMRLEMSFDREDTIRRTIEVMRSEDATR